jgi:hypothetical protein
VALGGVVDGKGAPGGSPGGSRTTESWGPAILKAAILLALSWIGFLFVPNRLLAYLATRVTPHPRDLLVTLWVAAFFVGMSFLFVALQKERRH